MQRILTLKLLRNRKTNKNIEPITIDKEKAKEILSRHEEKVKEVSISYTKNRIKARIDKCNDLEVLMHLDDYNRYIIEKYKEV